MTSGGGLSLNKWPRHYRCYVCEDDGRQVPAAFRFFSGIMGGGWPACEAHEPDAATAALKPLGRPETPAGHEVRAYRVHVDDLGWPFIRSAYWSAKKLPATPSEREGGGGK